MPKINILQIGKEVLKNEADAIQTVGKNLDSSFIKTIELLYHAKGKIVLAGIGKSGIVARKIAATLSSTGTFSLFVHPVEALHGDFGMVQKDDVIIVISHSGETPEVVNFINILKSHGNKIIAITANKTSTIAKLSDIILLTHVKEEACKICTTFNLAPTTSALAELALGDAMSSALQEMKGFKREHFMKFHPGGTLGKSKIFKK
ncbi:MAG: SIS domain-containing protein [Candidatus Sungiibacteriota bacterium]|uniref:SIS domain-containing protein n=1 Tax=Candidatus Sungiibacteriota bacterium TaxID=2750080 RepID=A0A7T5RK22_9BACT|nr:MAG: SIS domain-containing protein [Candidatus Sungbacteria bacterium]